MNNQLMKDKLIRDLNIDANSVSPEIMEGVEALAELWDLAPRLARKIEKGMKELLSKTSDA